MAGENRVLDLILIAENLTIMLACEAIALALVHETMKMGDENDDEDSGDESAPKKKAKMENNHDYQHSFQMERNPYLYLPKVLQNFKGNPTTLEIVGRQLWYTKRSDEDYVRAATRHYRLAEKAYPDSAYIRLLRLTFMWCMTTDSNTVIGKSDEISKMHPSFLVRFFLFKMNQKSKQKNAAMKARKDDAMDLVSYVEFQKYYQEAQRYNNKAVTAIRYFWSLFLRSKITFSTFNNAAEAVETHTKRANEVYQILLAKYPKVPQIVSSYAHFLEICMNDPEQAERYHRHADELRSHETEGNALGSTTDFLSNVTGTALDRQAVITASESGIIQDVNKGVMKMFGWSKSELIGRNLKARLALLAALELFSDVTNKVSWFELSSSVLRSNYAFKILDLIVFMTELSVNLGHAFPMRLTLRETRNDEGVRSFVGMVVKDEQDQKEGTVLAAEDGTIQMITEPILRMFGYTASEMVGKNVTMMMPEVYAASHATFLRRYIDTGERRVIGREGRNVPGKKKNGTEFPISLKVDEMFIENERYFIASVNDVADLQGTVYIDGFGMIQNCDQPFCMLLGYAKEELVGQNIKMIMPSPYCDYHDLYLERYRKTGVSNILNSREGRVLPALHADGSTVEVRLIVTRADSGDGSSFGNKVLFKGVLTRAMRSNADGKQKTTVEHPPPKGFRQNMVLHITQSGMIVKIDAPIVEMLGYEGTEVSQMIGMLVDVLVPPLPSRPSQHARMWLKNALQSPDQTFYVVMLRRNKSLCPAAIKAKKLSDGSVIIHVCNLLQTDSIVTINEFGIVMFMSVDAGMLLGHDPENVVGRNIKTILPPDIAEHHDEYIERYKQTGESHIVGQPRTTQGIHRDGTMIPIEIQVIEKDLGSERKFIGRLRHLEIPDVVDNELVENLWEQSLRQSAAGTVVPIHKKHNQSTGSMSSRSHKSGMSTDSIIKSMSFGRKILKSARASNPSQSGSKLEMLNDVSYPDVNAPPHVEPSVEQRKVMVGSQMSMGSVAHSVSSESHGSSVAPGAFENKINVVKNTKRENPSIRNFGLSLNTGFALCFVFLTACIITIALLSEPSDYLSFNQQMIGSSIYFDDLTELARELQLAQVPGVDQSPCSWIRSNATDANGKRPCPFAYSDPLAWKEQLQKQMDISVSNLANLLTFFQDNYRSIRIAGDSLDNYMQSLLNIAVYVATNPDLGTETRDRYFDLLSMYLESADVVSKAMDINVTKREWNFMIGNREQLCKHLNSFYPYLIHRSTRKMEQESTNSEDPARQTANFEIGSTVYDMVHRKYKVEEDEDEDDSDEEDAENAKSNENPKREAAVFVNKYRDKSRNNGHTKTELSQEFNVGIYLMIFLGILSIAIPLVVHYLWWTVAVQNLFGILKDFTTLTDLTVDLYELRWQTLDLFVECPEPFCTPFAQAKANVMRVVYELEKHAAAFEISTSSEKDFNDIFFGKSVCFSKDAPRCGPAANSSSMRLANTSQTLPPEFVSRTTRGLSNLLTNVARSSRILASANSTKDLDPEQFWFIYVVLPIEVKTGLTEVYNALEESFHREFWYHRTAAIATYSLTLGYVVILFHFVLRTIRIRLRDAAHCDQNVLFFLPLNVMHKNKAVQSYLEKLYEDVSN
ncbi:hypothetical protein HK102_003406 [Quaeritorhiza haematococci]|nr:hypothetical protein HK102_003406 [Quaeritorhiza haematococci]